MGFLTVDPADFIDQNQCINTLFCGQEQYATLVSLQSDWIYSAQYHSCTPCPENSFQFELQHTNPTCIRCDILQNQNCQSCALGEFFVAKSPNQCISQCNNGEKSMFYNKCTACPRNETTTDMSRTCGCVAGYERNSAMSCEPCRTGTYSPQFNTTCQSCKPGKFTSLLGQHECQSCPANWISTTPGSYACTPCGFGMISNHDNSACSSAYLSLESRNELAQYNVSILCVDNDISSLFKREIFIMIKQREQKWNKTMIGYIYDMFEDVEKSFPHGQCINAFLMSEPLTCPKNMFSVRKNSYIWECQMCPFAFYKNTLGTSYSECILCTHETCKEYEGFCENFKYIPTRQGKSVNTDNYNLLLN